MSPTRRLVLGSLAASLLPLPVRGAGESADRAFRTIEARPGTLRLKPAPAEETPVWAFDGTVPGPLLRTKFGEEVRVRLANKLEQSTTLCWHGMRIDNRMAGFGGLTQPPVAPGASFDYAFTPPDSGLYYCQQCRCVRGRAGR